MNVKKGDNVFVLSGKDKGKKGKVVRIITKTQKVVVEGLNIIKRHQKPTQKFQGGIVERPAPMPVSKVMVICPRCNKPSRLGRSDGQRVCKKCKEGIDKK